MAEPPRHARATPPGGRWSDSLAPVALILKPLGLGIAALGLVPAFGALLSALAGAGWPAPALWAPGLGLLAGSAAVLSRTPADPAPGPLLRLFLATLGAGFGGILLLLAAV